VSTEIETMALQGDQIDALEGAESNLTAHQITVYLQDTTKIDLGSQNKLANVSYGGGDAGGGNATTTYSYTTFNDLTVTHDRDPG